MPYLITPDYYKQIQQAQINQITGNDATLLTAALLIAEQEVKSYLVQKYLIDDEFADTTVWSVSATYQANSRVYLTANTYVPANSYIVNDLTLYSGSVYICTTPTTGVFDISKWALLGTNNAIFYAQYPVQLFDQKKFYNVDDQVFWGGRKYKCLIATQAISGQTAIQFGTYANIPAYNSFPDQNQNNQWQDLGAYAVPAATLPTNTTYWTLGDNRNQQILTYAIDIALYHLHTRIAPQNIPALRQNRYDDAKQWLIMAARGEITANLQKIQPVQGNRIRYGGNVKMNNIL